VALGHEQVQHFPWSRAADNFVALYRRVAGRT